MWRRLFRAGVTRKVPPHHSPAMPTPTTLQPAKHPPRRNSSRATEDPRRNQNFSPVSRGPACAPGASTIPAGSLRRAHFLTAQLEGDHVSRETRRNAYPSLHTNSSGSRCRNRHDLPSMIRAESQCAANACEPPVRYRTTMRTWSTAARTSIGMSACAHLAHGDRRPCSCFGVHRHSQRRRPCPHPSLHRQAGSLAEPATTASPTIDQDVAVAPNLDRRECPMRAPARQPTIPPFPIGGNSTVLVRGPG